jgi:hypothetical protein
MSTRAHVLMSTRQLEHEHSSARVLSHAFDALDGNEPTTVDR